MYPPNTIISPEWPLCQVSGEAFDQESGPDKILTQARAVLGGKVGEARPAGATPKQTAQKSS